MSTEIVTSFGSEGAELGRRCVGTIAFHWRHPLSVYVDDPADFASARLTSDIPGWLKTWDRLPVTRPDAPTTGSDQWTRKPDSYLWNARKFAVKAFVWLDAAERLGNGVLVWLDADTVTTTDVPSDLIETLMDGVDVAYLGRGAMHPETGFVAFRVPEALPLLRWCVDAYQSGAFASWADGWTDCHAIRAGLSAVSIKARDLTSHTWAGEWRSSVDAFSLSPLGPYVQHFKGPQRKQAWARRPA